MPARKKSGERRVSRQEKDVASATRDVNGDLIRGQISDSPGAVIGKNIIHIGKLEVPLLPLLAILLLLAAGLVFLGVRYVNSLGPTTMPRGSFNVAVAQFGVIDKDGSVREDALGLQASRWIFDNLKAELLAQTGGERPVVWHDSLPETEKNVKIGLVRGRTIEERQKEAKRIAESINATMLIYGNLKADEDPAKWTPEFYIAYGYGTGYADELLGAYQLGSPIGVPSKPNDPLLDRIVDEQIKARARLLIFLTRGLVEDLIGRHGNALDIFKKAETQLGLTAQPCEKGDGREILYYLLGREGIFLSNDENELSKYFKSVDLALKESESYFNQSLCVDANYTRAHIGLGNVYFQRSQIRLIGKSAETVDWNALQANLDRSSGEYRQAITSPASELVLKAHLSLGNVASLDGHAKFVQGQSDAADALFDKAIAEINLAMPLIGEKQYRLWGYTYLQLGQNYQEKAHLRTNRGDNPGAKAFFKQAIENYQKCAALPSASDVDLKKMQQDGCTANRDDAQRALDSLK